MKWIVFISIALINLSNLCSLERVLERHYLSLNDNNQISIGFSAITFDPELMQENSLSQASVVFTRLESAYSIDKYISVDSGSSQNEQNESAQVKYNVVSDLDRLKENYTLLQLKYSQMIYGNFVGFFSVNNKMDSLQFKPVDETHFPDNRITGKNGDTILSYGKGKAVKLDDAFELAFDDALNNYSKYIQHQINSLQKQYNDQTQLILEMNAINQISALEMASVEIEVLKNSASLIDYQVNIELRKKVQNENNSDNPLEIRVLPSCR